MQKNSAQQAYLFRATAPITVSYRLGSHSSTVRGEACARASSHMPARTCTNAQHRESRQEEPPCSPTNGSRPPNGGAGESLPCRVPRAEPLAGVQRAEPLTGAGQRPARRRHSPPAASTAPQPCQGGRGFRLCRGRPWPRPGPGLRRNPAGSRAGPGPQL